MLLAIASVFAVSGIAAFLAALLVVAQRYLADYGECEIDINDDRKLAVQGGESLLESLTQNEIYIPSACGGRGTCAYCKLKVVEGGGPIVPTEEPYLSPEEREEGIRLSCQVKIRNNVRIEIPPELLSVKQYTCTCARIEDLTHDIKAFRFELRDPAEISYTPGQYVQLYCPPYDNTGDVYRAYSIASNPEDKGVIDMQIRLVPEGICTAWCFNHLKEGDEVKINGPYGDFHLSDTDAPMIFIAGGTGMAPIECMLNHMRNTGNQREAVYFFGVNRADELFHKDTMHEFEKGLPNFRYVPVVAQPAADSGWTGETGLVTETLERNVHDASTHEAYLCGSPGMIDASIAVLTKLGMPEENIFYDKFA
ncbi:NADH:ubiquinone reductase (Na(+)-transporting) subunit F [Verrucomicrobiota bacterium]